MTVMRDMEIVWDDLLEAFANPDEKLIYLLDRMTGEIFFVPTDYEDEAFWEEIEGQPEHFLTIPGFDHDQERLLIQEFINGIGNVRLKEMITMATSGRGHGHIEEILSFYPEELDRYSVLKEEFLADRIREWLEANDIFPASESF